MAPLPKRRHSSARGGKREADVLAVTLKLNTRCPKCQAIRKDHRACPKCGFYK